MAHSDSREYRRTTERMLREILEILRGGYEASIDDDDPCGCDDDHDTGPSLVYDDDLDVYVVYCPDGYSQTFTSQEIAVIICHGHQRPW